MARPIDIDTHLTPQDHRQLAERGISLHRLKHQLAVFQRGIPFARLKKPCRLNDGIHRLDASDLPAATQDFDHARATGRVTKFVPASGVGTRMFQMLETSRLPATADRGSAAAQRMLDRFFSDLPRFAFYPDLKQTLFQQGHDLDRFIMEGRGEGHARRIIDALLDVPGLNYANLPKGLLAFHRYPATTRTPIEEHMVEAAGYAKDDQNHARIHFTVSPDHLCAVQDHIEQARQRLTSHPVTWIVDCSVQQPSTDTIAVDVDNRPFRDSRDQLLFRPAGHGALLSNLHDLRGDVVFIKNVDNVVHDHLKEMIDRHERVLGGLLVGLQRTVFSFLTQLESGTASSAFIKQVTEWAHHSLAMTVPGPGQWTPLTNSEKTQWLFQWLNRPLRICGMVPDVTHAGGGPFWVEQEDGTTSMQIVESSQVDPDAPAQQDIFTSSTHCNPVDMVCGVRDYRGNPFNLHRFVDPDTGFIATKSSGGRAVKALELPGLWNGSMAAWHSVFVEVPRQTFNPVKTVLDLLLPAHQPPGPF